MSPEHDVQLTLALRQRGTARLTRLVRAVSEPRSPQYGNDCAPAASPPPTPPTSPRSAPRVDPVVPAGKYLSVEQLRDVVQPSPATLMAVLKWLQSHGVEDCRSVATLDFLECRMPVR